MAAQPKNKITRVEQGKRRHGNTPKLSKDPKTTKISIHKVTFYAKMLSLFGSSSASDRKSDKPNKSAKKAKKAAPKTAGGPMTTQTAAKSQTPTVKKTTRTQHKGA